MANSKYAQVPAMAASGQLNWSRDRVLAFLYTGATFSAAHTRLSEVSGAQVAVSEIGGRYVGEGGEAVGMPATFDRVAKETNYQVIVAVDHGGGYSPGLIAFYDQDVCCRSAAHCQQRLLRPPSGHLRRWQPRVHRHLVRASDGHHRLRLTSGARTILRDYPLYFEVDVGPLNTLTIRLPHPLIMSASLQVYLTTTADPPVTVAHRRLATR